MDAARQERLIEWWVRHLGLQSDVIRDALNSTSEEDGTFLERVRATRAVSDDQIAMGISEVFGIPYCDLEFTQTPVQLVELVSSQIATERQCLPIREEKGVVDMVFSTPPTMEELGALRLALHRRIRPFIGPADRLSDRIRQAYGIGSGSVGGTDEPIDNEEREYDRVFEIRESETVDREDATVSKFVDIVLLEALRLRATDIHLEPYVESIRIRYRIDGALREIPAPRGLRASYPAIASRLKIMGGLDIAERRAPQDGRISARRGRDELDLRLSTIPTNHGESICLRILGRETLLLDLAELGLQPGHERRLRELARLPNGMVLITGPTGSGKTTTLYAALAAVNDVERKIITIEDPVEYQLPGISQIQTREEIGLTFAQGLRAALRHDPDVLLIGEIRDRDTAEIALRAAQTGHLVFSTLHTNDSVSAVTRMIEMGADPYLLAASLSASIAQRLARRICSNCARPDEDVDEEALSEIAEISGLSADQTNFRIGGGCELCGGRGYRGRVGLYEFFEMTPTIADRIGPDTRAGRLRDIASREGWRPLREDGLRKAVAGIIPVSEPLRLTRPFQRLDVSPEPGATG